MCYDKKCNCTLFCGHKFCLSCVKTWYMDGSGTCPMCRKKVRFRRMPLKKWAIEAEETKKEKVFQDTIDEHLEHMPEIDVLDMLQRTYRALKDWYDHEDIDYILNETSEYYSDRRVHLNYRNSFLENGHFYRHEKVYKRFKMRNR